MYILSCLSVSSYQQYGLAASCFDNRLEAMSPIYLRRGVRGRSTGQRPRAPSRSDQRYWGVCCIEKNCCFLRRALRRNLSSASNERGCALRREGSIYKKFLPSFPQVTPKLTFPLW
ncbi:hypothetical protein ACJJTC_011151 [Scirpophaga incertulas]